MITRSISRPIIRSIIRPIAGFADANAGFLSLDFVSNTYNLSGVQKQFDQVIEFSRPSGGGIWNAQRDFEWLGSDVPRFNFDPVSGSALGLLVEPQSTNLIKRSINILDWSESVSGPATDYAIGRSYPAELVGGIQSIQLNAKLLDQQRTYVATGASGALGDQYSYSVLAKAGTLTVICSRTTSIVAAICDLNTGAILSKGVAVKAATSEAFPDAWWLVSSTFKNDMVGLVPWIALPEKRSPWGLAWKGNPNDYLFVAAPQLEAGKATSYIPTQGAQVTRAADSVFIPNGPWRSPNGRLEADADEGVTVTLEADGIRVAGMGHIRSIKFYPEAA